MKRLLSAMQGSITVETAVTLPLVLLLTLGGISVLLWLHHKAWLQVLVSETARERAADAAWTGYYKDIRDSLSRPDPGLVLADVRLLSFLLPTDPPFVLAGACASSTGYVPTLAIAGAGAAEPGEPPPEGGGWLQPVRGLRWRLSRWLEQLDRLADEAEDHLETAVTLGEQAVWYRRVAEGLTGGDPHQARQAVDYVAGAAVEEVMHLPCRQDGSGNTVLTAKAVIQGERTFGQR